MQTQIQKWGNSLGVRIPRYIVDKLHIKKGVVVNMEIMNEHIVIIPEISELDLLVNNITEINCHSEILKDDKLIGKEVW